MNFARGENPPREDLKRPPMKTPEESERAFQYLAGMVTTMKSFPQVRFVTASEAFELFSDAAQNRVFSMQEVSEIASQVDTEVSYQTNPNYVLAPSETFALLNQFVSGVIRKRAAEPLLLERTPYGPDSAAIQLASGITVSWTQFSRTVRDVAGFLARGRQVPSQVWLGSTTVAPESYLVALAQVSSTLISKSEPPEAVTCSPARLATSRYVAADSPSLWSWPIFPLGFHSPHLMELARRQAWTLKPAKLRGAT